MDKDEDESKNIYLQNNKQDLQQKRHNEDIKLIFDKQLAINKTENYLTPKSDQL